MRSPNRERLHRMQWEALNILKDAFCRIIPLKMPAYPEPPTCQQGFVDRAEIKDGFLFVSGWGVAPGLGTINGIEISLDSRSVNIIRSGINLSSPDVAAAFPHIPAAQSCRFEIEAAVPPDMRKENLLCRVRPQFDCGHGRDYFHPVGLTLTLPPEHLIEGIGCGFLPVAFDFLSYFIRYGSLEAAHSVLDIGCGCGRMAYPLSLFLDKARGRYYGFDIVDANIVHAQRAFRELSPGFTFRKVDVYNRWYNPHGMIQPEAFSFPCEDSSFDFVFLTSVFTHMFEREIRNYLREIRRVLKTSGRCLATCFLLNDECEERQRTRRARVRFPFSKGNARISRWRNPEGAVAWPEDLLHAWIAETDMRIEHVLYGAWSGRPDFVDYQDILIISR